MFVCAPPIQGIQHTHGIHWIIKIALFVVTSRLDCINYVEGVNTTTTILEPAIYLSIDSGSTITFANYTSIPVLTR